MVRTDVMEGRPTRLAIIVSHPIQYYVPLYQLLAKRSDLAVKVFYTWHAAERPEHDRGFGAPIAWDIPLLTGYDHTFVPNISRDPGTHRFFGLRNPTLIEQAEAWQPDVVFITGWAGLSHLQAMRAFAVKGVPTLFRGDSHLLDDEASGLRWWFKRIVLRQIYAWPTAFLVVGAANRAYYRAFGVGEERLIVCPHSIDVARFAEPADTYESEAAAWRRELGLSEARCILLFAGKFEAKKQPLALMRAVQRGGDDVTLVLVGGGALESDVRAIAAQDPGRFIVLPFQNQSRMPVVYRLGHLFVLPSSHNETWGLAVNEAMACGRPVLVSDRVGCAADLVDADCGRVFSWADVEGLKRAINELIGDRTKLARMGKAAAARSRRFDVAHTAQALSDAIGQVLKRNLSA